MIGGGASQSDEHHHIAISGQRRIRRQEMHGLCLRLRDQHAVVWVAMQLGQGSDSPNMVGLHLQRAEPGAFKERQKAIDAEWQG
jgi:hypothetical protein